MCIITCSVIYTLSVNTYIFRSLPHADDIFRTFEMNTKVTVTFRIYYMNIIVEVLKLCELR